MQRQRVHPDSRYALAENALDDVRVILQADGGDIVLRSISPDGRRIEVSLTGVCESCPVSEITLGGIVRAALRRYFPDLEQVVHVPEPDGV